LPTIFSLKNKMRTKVCYHRCAKNKMLLLIMSSMYHQYREGIDESWS
jgi:hypothetical protein